MRESEAGAMRTAGPGGFDKILLVVRREFLERVKTKAFIISTLLVPLLLGMMMFAPLLLSRISPDKPLRLAVVDETGLVYDDLEKRLASDPDADYLKARGGEKIRRYQLERAGGSGAAPAARLEGLSGKVEEKALDAYIVIPEAILAEEKEAAYYGKTVSNLEDIRRIQRALTEVLVARRLSDEGVDPAKAREITRTAQMSTVKLGVKGEQAKRGVGEELIVIMIYTMFIYTNILIYGTALTRSLIEEKMNRVSEILLSSLTPFQLMIGKIVGVGAVGLAQFLIWTGTAMGFYAFRGMSPQTDEIFSAIEPFVLGYIVLYFVLGYFLYASLFCIVGAMSTSEQEAQNSQTPVVMVVVVSLLLGISLMRQPGSTLTVALSHIPFMSPILMFMRIQALRPPLWEILLNVGVILVFIAGTAWVAGRVFRVGVLMTGKKATIPEIVRWIRAA